MLASTHTGAIAGIRGQIIAVEVDASAGFPRLIIVGLPDSAVRESESRIKAALRNSGFEFSWDRRITISLAPAHLRKAGSAFDLPIAVALLGSAAGPAADPRGSLFLGELALDGSLRPVPGVLPIVMEARARGFRNVVVPRGNFAEASLVSGVTVRGFSTLLGVVTGQERTLDPPHGDDLTPNPGRSADLQDVSGQPLARRALEIAAAGRHNLLMIGPPGSGKTMLARRLPGILPPPSPEEALEMTSIQSAAGLTPRALLQARPFRSPHHTASLSALVGGGAIPRPGEISLAHGGVLFLDELPEFPRATLEGLRQPLEEGRLIVSRARAAFEFPASFQLIAAMNPCPCGYRGDPVMPCRCTPLAVSRYQGRISGPLLDRIDLVVEVPRPEIPSGIYTHGLGGSAGESSAVVRERVLAGDRFGRRRGGEESGSQRELLDLEEGAAAALEDAAKAKALSLRAVHRTTAVARTIADLAQATRIPRAAVLEALLFRPSGALTLPKLA